MSLGLKFISMFRGLAYALNPSGNTEPLNVDSGGRLAVYDTASSSYRWFSRPDTTDTFSVSSDNIMTPSWGDWIESRYNPIGIFVFPRNIISGIVWAIAPITNYTVINVEKQLAGLSLPASTPFFLPYVGCDVTEINKMNVTSPNPVYNFSYWRLGLVKKAGVSTEDVDVYVTGKYLG